MDNTFRRWLLYNAVAVLIAGVLALLSCEKKQYPLTEGKIIFEGWTQNYKCEVIVE